MTKLMAYRLGGAFDDFFNRPLAQPLGMRVDVSETGDAYLVKAEMPGANKDAIEVDVVGDRVSISADASAQGESRPGERVLWRERHYGKLTRSFRLGAEIDGAAASAKYANGVLVLTLPKKPEHARRQLAIQ